MTRWTLTSLMLLGTSLSLLGCDEPGGHNCAIDPGDWYEEHEGPTKGHGSVAVTLSSDAALGSGAFELEGAEEACFVVSSNGSCTAFRCWAPTLVDAGNVSLTTGNGAQAFRRAADNTYYQAWAETLGAGESIHFDATGNIAPPNSVDVVVPERLEATAPESIDRLADLELAWTPAEGLASVEMASGNTVIRCEADAGDGGVTVGADLLAELYDSATLTVSSVSRSSASAGLWDIDAEVRVEAVSATVTFE